MIAIVDYQAGNLTSVERAVREVGFRGSITADAETILKADKVIFPGVGAARQAMQSLQKSGLDAVLKKVAAGGTPLLGICIGCQILLEHSEESDTPCLGIIKGQVIRFPADSTRKVPHMGWNRVKQVQSSPLFNDIPDDAYFYFVHSYYPKPLDPDTIYGITDYGVSFPAVIGKDNVIAVQFHTEKSGAYGLQLLKNFCAL